jgi:S-adenosylmethionine-diacylgycerolhomoserine-N-methlytransferase
MSWLADLRTMAHTAFRREPDGPLAQRLDSYYRAQASHYDAFRRRLLHGRGPLLDALGLSAGERVLDMGGGTGFLWELAGPVTETLRAVTLIDLCPALLEVARARGARLGWRNVHIEEADATTVEPRDAPFDAVVFSYSLTMIPDWFRAIDRAIDLLRPGGRVGVADFYVARKWPGPGMRRHAGWRRPFWAEWFRGHNVFLSPDHLPYLQSRFEVLRLEERLGTVPYMLGLRAPYFVFVGRKPA